MSTNFEDVGDFHTKFGLPSNNEDFPGPRLVTRETMEYRIKFLQEELDELTKASAESNHPEMFDALLDIVYVAMGTAHLLGYPWEQGWDRVQAANMQKVRAKDASESKRGNALDVVKPEGWQPPDHSTLLGAWRGMKLTSYLTEEPSCPEKHPITGNPCVVEGPHIDHRAMGEKRMQIFGDHLAEGPQ